VVERRGRNVEAAERAVRESVSFTDQEALAEGLIEHVVADVPALLGVLDGKPVRRFDASTLPLDLGGATVERVEMSFRQRVLAAIALPQVAYLLFLLGVLGLYVEFSHPGLVLPGVVGVLSLLLALYATTVLPVNVVGVLLLLAAAALFVLEATLSSYGVLGVGGAVALVLGSLMLFEGEMPGVELEMRWILPASLVTAAVMMALATLVVRSRRLRYPTGREGMIGLRGTALSPLGPSGGRIFVHGEYWNARAARPIASGGRVRVLAVHDLELEVEEDRPADVASA
jgi:membrane-bound serine protease (ClpP class)